MRLALLIFVLALVSPCQASEALPSELIQRLATFEAQKPHLDHCILFRGFSRDRSKNDFSQPKFKQGEFLFYNSPTSVSDSDSSKILKLIFAPANHQKNVPKMCGGFHPDYTIHWKTTAGFLKIMVCLWCHEWRISNGKSQIYSDPTETAFETLKGIVTPYLKNAG